MDEFIKLLDLGLDYISHEMIGDTNVIRVISIKEKAVCPYADVISGEDKESMWTGFKNTYDKHSFLYAWRLI